MSYQDGWAAMNLQMPRRVPHFEPSADWYHWDLIRTVTGLDVSEDSPTEERQLASQAFVRAWNYDLQFGCLIFDSVLNAKRTRMGHGDFARDGRDFDRRISCPFKSPEEVLAFDPWEVYGEVDEAGLVGQFNENYRSNCERNPDCVNTTGINVTLMSGLIAIFGWEMLLNALAADADRFGEVANRYAAWIGQHYRAMAKSDAPVVYCHDDLMWSTGPFIHPDWYRKYIFPNLKRLWRPLVEKGTKIIFVCDGNYTGFLGDAAACGAHGFWFEIFTDLNTVCERYGETHVIIGNADCRPLTFGTKADIRAEVERCIAAGKRCPGYFMCVSGHIPANVPVENALYYYDVYQQLSVR